MDKLANTMKVRRKAYNLGFDACGFARAEPLDEEARKLESWLNEGRQGTMTWMDRHFDKRIDPTKLVPGAKSVISLLASYHFEKNLDFDRQQDVPKIAKYARGHDYHKVFKKKLKDLFNFIRCETGEINGRLFVDSAPVLEKAWSTRAGLGWIGKNANLLNKRTGSFVLIGEIILDLDFVYDTQGTDHCGTCTRCIDACPTGAIYEPYKVDSNRCISYLTIELKDQIPHAYRSALGQWIFGCDICQDVCPWNRKAVYGNIDDLKPRQEILNGNASWWEELSEETYNSIFEGTAIRRAKYPKLRQAIDIVTKNMRSGDMNE